MSSSVITVIKKIVVSSVIVAVSRIGCRLCKEKVEKTQLIKNKYNLLLVIPADKLISGITTSKHINKDEISKLLQYTKYAYCFEVDNKDGRVIVDKLILSDEKIDNTTDKNRNIFIHIILEAYSGIEEDKFRVYIEEKIPTDTIAEVKAIKILKKARSARDFYEIL